MLKVLLVEDSEERQAILRQLYSQHCVIVCRNAEEAIVTLAAESVDIVHLDYDLEGDLTGEVVARSIVETQKKVPVIVHSENAEGVRAIKAILPSALAVPISAMRSKEDDVALLKALLARPDLEDAGQVVESFSALSH